jgi:3-deoxy-D-manno-octulosonic-acid transferase
MQNFAEVTRLALENSASIQVQTPEELTTAITDLYKNPEKCTAMASAASELIAANRGASKRYADLIRELLDQRG